METTKIASAADAELILKLYELRQEASLRAARLWAAAEFWPTAADEVKSILADFGSPRNCQLRQATSYWEMAAAFVLRGALDAELFLECTGENLLLLAKFHPWLDELRAARPGFLARTERLTEQYPTARASFEGVLAALPSRRDAWARRQSGSASMAR